MTALGLNQLAHGQRAFGLPFAPDNEIAGNALQAPQHMRNRLGRRLLERYDLDIIVIQAQVIALALQDRITGLIVDIAVIFEAYPLHFMRGVVEKVPQETKRLLFV